MGLKKSDERRNFIGRLTIGAYLRLCPKNKEKMNSVNVGLTSWIVLENIVLRLFIWTMILFLKNNGLCRQARPILLLNIKWTCNSLYIPFIELYFPLYLIPNILLKKFSFTWYFRRALRCFHSLILLMKVVQSIFMDYWYILLTYEETVTHQNMF